MFWKYRDEIKKQLSNDEIKEILQYNKQTIVKPSPDDVCF